MRIGGCIAQLEAGNTQQDNELGRLLEGIIADFWAHEHRRREESQASHSARQAEFEEYIEERRGVFNKALATRKHAFHKDLAKSETRLRESRIEHSSILQGEVETWKRVISDGQQKMVKIRVDVEELQAAGHDRRRKILEGIPNYMDMRANISTLHPLTFIKINTTTLPHIPHEKHPPRKDVDSDKCEAGASGGEGGGNDVNDEGNDEGEEDFEACEGHINDGAKQLAVDMPLSHPAFSHPEAESHDKLYNGEMACLQRIYNTQRQSEDIDSKREGDRQLRILDDLAKQFHDVQQHFSNTHAGLLDDYDLISQQNMSKQITQFGKIVKKSNLMLRIWRNTSETSRDKYDRFFLQLMDRYNPVFKATPSFPLTLILPGLTRKQKIELEALSFEADMRRYLPHGPHLGFNIVLYTDAGRMIAPPEYTPNCYQDLLAKAPLFHHGEAQDGRSSQLSPRIIETNNNSDLKCSVEQPNIQDHTDDQAASDLAAGDHVNKDTLWTILCSSPSALHHAVNGVIHWSYRLLRYVGSEIRALSRKTAFRHAFNDAQIDRQSCAVHQEEARNKHFHSYQKRQKRQIEEQDLLLKVVQMKRENAWKCGTELTRKSSNRLVEKYILEMDRKLAESTASREKVLLSWSEELDRVLQEHIDLVKSDEEIRDSDLNNLVDQLNK
ncbi:hypothetical protein C0991_002857 [Blastosporella zonata]|nr:hypothetical protein C0991_002857 [Blastosporella zonata]